MENENSDKKERKKYYKPKLEMIDLSDSDMKIFKSCGGSTVFCANVNPGSCST